MVATLDGQKVGNSVDMMVAHLVGLKVVELVDRKDDRLVVPMVVSSDDLKVVN